jgi:hypothetical protein
MIEHQTVRDLKSFYRLMMQTRDVRFGIVNDLLSSRLIQKNRISNLQNALSSLEATLVDEFKAALKIDGSESTTVDLTYEITELKKDIRYLNHGENALISHFETIYPDFPAHVKAGVSLLEGKRFNCWITDRDGTTNNYCGRYRSSVQSIYNAVFISRFAKSAVAHPIMMTSAPLKDIGIVDVSIMPDQTIIYAASKGREFIDLANHRRSFPIEAQKQELIQQLYQRLCNLLKNQAHEKFTMIGSGLQFKFGQITIARQDISGSIPAPESDAFLHEVKNLIRATDPTDENFRIEDTGLDIEIILTISDEKTGLKDFDKADGIKYLEKELNLEMHKGPHLVCGDTGSDVPMLETAMGRTEDTFSVFVTKNQELAERVKTICPNTVIIPEPDMLVTILNQLSKQN